MKKYSYLFLLCFIIAGKINAQVPSFNSVTVNTASPQKLEKLEFTVSLSGTFTNPYDYSDIALRGIFTAPGGRKDTVDGFYMQDYALNTTNGNLTPAGSGIFKLRYTPTEAGNWQYQLSCTNTLGTTLQNPGTFSCVDAPGKGFIRKNNSPYLAFDNGEQYIPVGENVAWQQTNRYTDYKSWTTKLSDNKANFLRLWLCHWGFGIEWKNNYDNFTGLRKYKQSNAYYLDWLLDECKAKGLYMMLCLNHHGQVSTTTDPNWSDNPYNAANGGPCANTWDFFTNSTAKAAHKNRLRYIVARWGYSPNIESWELFNEVEWTDQFSTRKNDVKDWHNEMATYLKSIDVTKHLVTTSYANETNDPATWNLASIDFTQTHYYNSSPNIETILSSGNKSYLANFNKPTVIGEFGLSASSVATLITNDPNGTNIHNSLWATMFSGAMGPASPWYWNDYLDPQNLYYHFKPVSDVSALIPFRAGNYRPASATVSSSVTSDASFSPGVNYGGATAAAFTVNSDGTLSPGINQLGQYLFGSVYNTQNRNPPTFSVNYPVAGQFKVATGGATGTSPTIAIWVDGIQVFNQPAAVNSTYSVNISAGNHSIKVDNLGTDWILISSYTFTKVGSPFNIYILKSADSYGVTGWIHNKNYNWSYIKNTGTPAAIADGVMQVPGVQNGSYLVRFYNCSTGLAAGTANVIVNAGILSFALPSVSWDIAFSTIEDAVLPLEIVNFSGISAGDKNILKIDIASERNVRSVMLQRSADAAGFNDLAELSRDWSSIPGAHDYTDNLPLKAVNFYRLKIIDKDGTVSYSAIVKLSGRSQGLSVYPNPFKNDLTVFSNIKEGRVQLLDATGRVVLTGKNNTAGDWQALKLNSSGLAAGTYFLVARNAQGKLVASETIVKQ